MSNTYVVQQNVDGAVYTTEVSGVEDIQTDPYHAARVDLVDAQGTTIASFLNAHKIVRKDRL